MAFPTASVPVLAAPRPLAALPPIWMLALLVALPLLAWIAPRYEASGVPVAPLTPALVLALGAAAMFGWRALPFVTLGAALASIGWPITMPDSQDLLGALTLIAQAAFGGMLLRRSGRADDLALDSRPALRRLLAAALACGATGGTLQTLGDMAWSSDPTLRPLALALVRAIADAASIVLLLPVLFAFVAAPRARWLPRRRTVALPLAALAGLLWIALAGIDERDRQQAQSRFERDAEVVFARTLALLDAPVQALQALQGAFKSAPDALSATQFDIVAQPWVKRALGMGGIGWLELPVSATALASASSSATALSTAAALSTTGAAASTTASATATAAASPGGPAAAATPPATALANIGPARVRHVLGAVPQSPAAASAPPLSVLDLPALRPSTARAAVQDLAAVSPPVPLGVALDARSGFVLFQSLPANTPPSIRALGFAIISADALIAPIIAARSDGLRACLFDTDVRLDQRRLAGPVGCETGAAGDQQFSREAEFDFSGRRWALRASQPVRTSGGVWLFALPALAGSALLAVLLAGMTGQVQRVRHEARSRSDELKREIDQHARSEVVHERIEHALMDTVQTGVAMVDANGRIQRVNAAFAELAGSSAEALHLKPLDDVLADDERPAPGRFARFIQAADDTLMHETIRLRNADGRVMPSLVSLRVLRDDAGRANSVICAVHDLSESLRRRHVEQVLGNVLDLSRGDGKPVTAAQATAARQCRLLCIAGESGLADSLRQALHDRPNMVVLSAPGGPEGLVAARTQGPQLVLLDLDLPDADGLVLMRKLCAEGLPVIALSGDLRPQRIDEAFAAGARAYLTLPPEPRELLAVIDDLV